MINPKYLFTIFWISSASGRLARSVLIAVETAVVPSTAVPISIPTSPIISLRSNLSDWLESSGTVRYTVFALISAIPVADIIFEP